MSNSDVNLKLGQLGFVKLEEPNPYNDLIYSCGSIANFTKVVLGEEINTSYPDGTDVVARHVTYIRMKESGEDLLDYSIEEKKCVAVPNLLEYLASKGIK